MAARHTIVKQGETLADLDAIAQRSCTINSSEKRQHDLLLYKLALKKQMVRRDILHDQKLVKKKLRKLKRNRKHIKTSDELLSKEDFSTIARTVSLLPPLKRKYKCSDGNDGGGMENNNDELAVLNHKETNEKVVGEQNSSAEKAVDITLPAIVVSQELDDVTLPSILEETVATDVNCDETLKEETSNIMKKNKTATYRPFLPNIHHFSRRAESPPRKPSVASTISPILPIIPSAPYKLSYQFGDVDDEDFFKILKKRQSLPEVKILQDEEKEKSSNMKEKIDRFFDGESVAVPPKKKQHVRIRRHTEVFNRSPLYNSTVGKTNTNNQYTKFQWMNQTLSDEKARGKGKLSDDAHLPKDPRKRKLHKLASVIIPRALERVKVISEYDKASRH